MWVGVCVYVCERAKKTKQTRQTKSTMIWGSSQLETARVTPPLLQPHTVPDIVPDFQTPTHPDTHTSIHDPSHPQPCPLGLHPHCWDMPRAPKTH